MRPHFVLSHQTLPDQVATIPRHICLSSDPSDAPQGTLRAWAHSLLATCSPADKLSGYHNSGVSFDKDVAVVTLQLILERAAGPKSSFAPWMKMLPRSRYLNLPVLWPKHDLAELRGTLVLRDAEELLKAAVVELQRVSAAILEGLESAARNVVDGELGIPQQWYQANGKMLSRLTMTQWLQARCMVQSRAYRVGSRCVHPRSL